MNQYDGQALQATLTGLGLQSAPAGDPVDLVIINTCAITTTAMRKSRQAIRKALRRSPDAAVLITGCYADYDAAEIAGALAEFDLPPHRLRIAGHHQQLVDDVQQYVRQLADETGADEAAPADAPFFDRSTLRARRNAVARQTGGGTDGLDGIDRFDGHQRAFVKVQDGCDAFCSYCIVPYTRCRVWSRPTDEIETECRRLIDAGHRELVLSGVFLGAFGRSTSIRRNWAARNDDPLADLVVRIARLPGLWKLRLSSLEPGDLTDRLLDVCASNQTVAPHFHLPLQAGSDRVLQRMNRQYSADEFRRTIQRLNDRLDQPAVTTDIIVGFAGETEADFAETLAVSEVSRFSKIHAFPFSAIEGTVAHGWRGEGPSPEVVRERMQRLGELEQRLAEDYRKQFVGREVEGLVERPRADRPGERQAMTDRYLSVSFGDDGMDRTGRVVQLRVTGLSGDGLRGVVTGEKSV